MDQDSMAELRERYGLTEKEVASLCEKATRHGMSRNHIMKMRQRYAAAPEEPKEMMAAEAVKQAHGLLDEIARLEEVQQLFGNADTVMVSGHCQDPSRPYGHSFSVRMSKEEIVDSITVVLSARIDEARAKLGELGVE